METIYDFEAPEAYQIEHNRQMFIVGNPKEFTGKSPLINREVKMNGKLRKVVNVDSKAGFVKVGSPIGLTFEK